MRWFPARKIMETAFFLLVVFQITVAARDVSIADFSITNTRDDLIANLTIEGAFREDMKKVVLSGVPITFSFFIQLERTRQYWIDTSIADITMTHTIKYHALKKEFIVTRSWENDKPIAVESFKEAQKLMCEINNLKVASLSQLKKGRTYRIRAKAELSQITLPYHLNYPLFFPMWNFETEWYLIDFVY